MLYVTQTDIKLGTLFSGSCFSFKIFLLIEFLLFQGMIPQTRNHSVSIPSLQYLCSSVAGSGVWAECLLFVDPVSRLGTVRIFSSSGQELALSSFPNNMSTI